MADSNTVAEIERWFRAEDDPAAFAREIFPHYEIKKLREDIKDQMRREGLNIVDDYFVAQRLGGEFAKRMMEQLKYWNESRLSAARNILSEQVCPIYIDLKKTGTLDSEPLKIAIAVADALTSAALAFPAPIPRVSVYIIRNHLLDKWCAESATRVLTTMRNP